MLLQTETSDLAMNVEQFVVLLYDRTSDITNVRTLKTYHHSQSAKQHIKQARHQSIRWKEALTAMLELPDPANWG